MSTPPSPSSKNSRKDIVTSASKKAARSPSPSTGKVIASPVRQTRFARFFRFACQAAIIVGLCLGAYLCLRPSGRLRDLSWLPGELEYWADYNGRIRNFPAFAALALPFMFVCNGRRARRKTVAALAGFAAALELLQYFIPNRDCEWQDITWSWAGLGATWLTFEFACWSVGRVRRTLKQRRIRRTAQSPIASSGRSTRALKPAKKAPDHV